MKPRSRNQNEILSTVPINKKRKAAAGGGPKKPRIVSPGGGRSGDFTIDETDLKSRDKKASIYLKSDFASAHLAILADPNSNHTVPADKNTLTKIVSDVQNTKNFYICVNEKTTPRLIFGTPAAIAKNQTTLQIYSNHKYTSLFSQKEILQTLINKNINVSYITKRKQPVADCTINNGRLVFNIHREQSLQKFLLMIIKNGIDCDVYIDNVKIVTNEPHAGNLKVISNDISKNLRNNIIGVRNVLQREYLKYKISGVLSNQTVKSSTKTAIKWPKQNNNNNAQPAVKPPRLASVKYHKGNIIPKQTTKIKFASTSPTDFVIKVRNIEKYLHHIEQEYDLEKAKEIQFFNKHGILYAIYTPANGLRYDPQHTSQAALVILRDRFISLQPTLSAVQPSLASNAGVGGIDSDSVIENASDSDRDNDSDLVTEDLDGVEMVNEPIVNANKSAKYYSNLDKFNNLFPSNDRRNIGREITTQTLQLSGQTLRKKKERKIGNFTAEDIYGYTSSSLDNPQNNNNASNNNNNSNSNKAKK